MPAMVPALSEVGVALCIFLILLVPLAIMLVGADPGPNGSRT